MTIDDNDKQKILDSLSKESTMVIMTAFVYAKTYVEFGEDITKAWTTATQQASILEKVKQKAMAEAYDSFKKDYEARIKDNMVDMLTEIKDEANNIRSTIWNCSCFSEGIRAYNNLIQHKINELKAESEGNE